jgi:hypothetical protein
VSLWWLSHQRVHGVTSPLLRQHPPYRRAPQAQVPCNRCLAEALQRQCLHLRGIIGWGTRSAMRLPAFAGISNAGFEALTDQSPLELRTHREEAGAGASCWRREIEGLRQRDNSHAQRHQFVQRHHEVDEGAPPPVELPDQHHIELALLSGFEQGRHWG